MPDTENMARDANKRRQLYDIPAMMVKFKADKFRASYKVSDSGCWQWHGYTDRQGYGRFCLGRIQVRAHRIAWYLKHGTNPPCLDHLCRVRNCVNPDHLEPVTNRENVVRGNSARPVRAECNKGHEFTEQNTYINPKGRRECRKCRHAATVRYKEKTIG